MSYKSNILATLAYYDVFDFPLKGKEIFNFLINLERLSAPESPQTPNFDEIKVELEKLRGEGVINFSDGFYFLFGKQYLIPLRIKREKLAKRKWQKAIWAVKWLRLVPYIRGVLASGSLAMSNTDELSDLDVLVIVKYGHIWLARFLINGLLSFLRVRRRGFDKLAPNKICLNHYITDEYLNIPLKSIYNAQTYANLLPIYLADEKLVEKFKEENSWVLDYVYRWANIDSRNHKMTGPGICGYIAKVQELILDKTGLGVFLNNMARSYQFDRINRNPVTRKSGGRVVFNDKQLEFHPSSIERDIIEKYNQRLKSLGLDELAIEKDSGLTSLFV